MQQVQEFQQKPLAEKGLNLAAIFNISDLPYEISIDLEENVDDFNKYKQLIVIGHAGRKLWETVKASGLESANPIDEFSVQSVQNFFAEHYPDHQYQLLYPLKDVLPLQELGKLAGWHHMSPFMLGINKQWGSWYAYRAVLVSDTAFKPTPKVNEESPCESCTEKPCISHCPADAVHEDTFDLLACLAYRKQSNSPCRDKCLARMACPVGTEHRYSDEQINYHYLRSMKLIEES